MFLAAIRISPTPQSVDCSFYDHARPRFRATKQAARDCWTVAFGNAFSDEDRCVAAGYDNGDVKLYDLRTQSMRWETNVKNGVTALEFDRSDIEMNKVRRVRVRVR